MTLRLRDLRRSLNVVLQNAVAALIEAAHERYRATTDGATSRVYPALERADPDLFGVCIVGTSGRAHEAGDAEVEFAIAAGFLSRCLGLDLFASQAER